MKTIGIVTPWADNHPELIEDYFAAVEPEQPDQLVVVDAANDPPLPFAAVRSEERLGFCAASNVGLALIETDLVVMLNNDIAPLRAGWLAEMRDAIEDGVIAGPLRHDEHGAVDGVSYPYVDGWCLGITTADARRLGGWDESYDEVGPAYYSDNAFSLEARLQGMTLREVRPGLRHKGGATGGGGVNMEAFQTALRVNGAAFAARVREATG